MASDTKKVQLQHQDVDLVGQSNQLTLVLQYEVKSKVFKGHYLHLDWSCSHDACSSER